MGQWSQVAGALRIESKTDMHILINQPEGLPQNVSDTKHKLELKLHCDHMQIVHPNLAYLHLFDQYLRE